MVSDFPSLHTVLNMMLRNASFFGDVAAHVHGTVTSCLSLMLIFKHIMIGQGVPVRESVPSVCKRLVSCITLISTRDSRRMILAYDSPLVHILKCNVCSRSTLNEAETEFISTVL